IQACIHFHPCIPIIIRAKNTPGCTNIYASVHIDRDRTAIHVRQPVDDLRPAVAIVHAAVHASPETGGSREENIILINGQRGYIMIVHSTGSHGPVARIVHRSEHTFTTAGTSSEKIVVAVDHERPEEG